LQSLSNELAQVEINAKEQLDKATLEAEEERKQLVSDIAALQSALEETTTKIDTAKEEMDVIANNSSIALKLQQMQVSQKDDEINQLMQQQEELQMNINSLTIQLDEVRNALVDSEKVAMQLEKQMDDLKRESEEARKADQNLIERIKSQFMQEKDSLTDQLQTFTQDLLRVKEEKEEQLQQIKEDTENEKEKLMEERSTMQIQLDNVRSIISATKEEMVKVKQQTDAQVKRQSNESKRLDRAVKEVSAREKKELKVQIWDLETKVEAARYNLNVANKETKALKASVALFEDQIKELEESNKEQVRELEERIRADQMFYASSNTAAKTRMQGLVEKFQRRTIRREQKAKQDIEDTRLELTKQFDSQEKSLQIEKEDAVEAMRVQGESELDAASKEFDAKVMDLNKQMNLAKDKAQKRMNDMKTTYEGELKFERIKSEKEKEAVIAMKNTEIKKVEEEARRSYSMLQMDTTQKLYQSSQEKRALQGIIKEQNGLIENYEAERTSFRKLAKLTWLVTKEKITKRRGQQGKPQ